MKIKKRFLSLFLAVLLVTSMATSVSAATVAGFGTYGGATFATSSSCYTDHWSCIMEVASCEDSEDNYVMNVDVVSYKDNGDGTGSTKQFTLGDYSTYVASNYGTANYTIFGIYAYYYSNDTQVCNPVWAPAG